LTPLISVIVPNHNGEKTIGHCLDAVYGSTYDNFEVIIVDDCSVDSSVSIIEQYPCKLLRLTEHGGASKARNTGAQNSKGELLFFIDADCLVQPDTLSIVALAYQQGGPDVVIGGTYTLMPFDQHFFSIFQSVFNHCAETKNLKNPDYIATHAMVIAAGLFKTIGGFDEHFMPILEDVEFSHRLKEKNYQLLMDEAIQVQHIFNFNLLRSLKNGFTKSKYWTRYSIANKDLLGDSGTASQGLKFNVVSCFLSLFLLLGAITLGLAYLAVPVLLLLAVNLLLNRSLIHAFYKTKGFGFTVLAVLYYIMLYPLAVGLGALNGLINHLSGSAL
jgi:glycosyltransferase involved in cell wall biosynthesis